MYVFFFQARNRPHLDLDHPNTTDEEIKMWTGWRRDQLSIMSDSISGTMKLIEAQIRFFQEVIKS